MFGGMDLYAIYDDLEEETSVVAPPSKSSSQAHLFIHQNLYLQHLLCARRGFQDL